MKAIVAFPVFLGVVILDQISKLVAEATLAATPQPVFGEWFRFALVYNPGAAFGLHLGAYSRWIFMVLTVVAVVTMWRLYRASPPDAVWRVRALLAVTGGAFGNFVDRIISPRGVVDFLDVGVGAWRWPTFNLADIAVSTGAILLAIVLWNEEEERVTDAKAVPSTESPTST